MSGCANISFNGILLPIILLYLATWDWEFLKNDKLLLFVLVLTSLITTLRTTFFLFFFLIVGTDVSTFYSSFTTDLCCSRFAVGVRAQIARGTRFILYKIDRLIIAISLALSSKSIGMSSRTWILFSCTLYWYWLRIINGQQTWIIQLLWRKHSWTTN